MSKKEVLVIIIIFLIAFLVSSIFNYKAQSKEHVEEVAEIENISENEEKEIVEETTEVDVELTENVIVEEPVVEIQEEIEEPNETPIQTSQKIVTEPVNTKSTRTVQNTNNSKSETPQVNESPKVPEEPKQEQKQEQVVTTPPKQEKIYCVDGGSIHIFGDGPNEHGYYNSWDEAFSAYESYTAGWESTHYMVGQCACGLYYFTATK